MFEFPARTVLMDGAMGSELLRRGMTFADCPSRWNRTHPEHVAAVHRAYVDVGAEIVLTNTFQANPIRLAFHGRLEQGPDLVRAGVELARASGARWVFGAIGPIYEDPGGKCFPSEETVRTTASWFTDVDGLLLETCGDTSAFDAVEFLGTPLPIWLSFTYRHDRHQGILTWDDHTPEQIAQMAQNSPIAALGVNCGSEQSVVDVGAVIRRYRQATDLPLFARPNAGTPSRVNDEAVYSLGIEELTELPLAMLAAVGGCCGTTPAHIAALRRALERPGSESGAR